MTVNRRSCITGITASSAALCGEILRSAQDDNRLRTNLAASSIATRILDGSAFPVPAMSSAVP